MANRETADGGQHHQDSLQPGRRVRLLPLRRPRRDGKVPAIVLASAVHGVDKDIRDLADEFASHGYIAAAPDLFWRSRARPARRDDKRAQERSQPRLEKIKAGEADMADTLAESATLPQFNGRAAAMGFCYGGPYAILGPKRLGYDAGISCHGTRLIDFIHELDGVTQPVCIIWGDQDHAAPRRVLDAYRAVPARMKNVEVHIFPGVLHGYMMRGNAKAFSQRRASSRWRARWRSSTGCAARASGRNCARPHSRPIAGASYISRSVSQISPLSFLGPSQRVRPSAGPMTGSAREPGIHNHSLGLWIPGPALTRRPGTTADGFNASPTAAIIAATSGEKALMFVQQSSGCRRQTSRRHLARAAQMERRIRDIGSISIAVVLVSALLGVTPVLAGPIATGKQTADVTRMTAFTYRPAGCSDPSLLLVFHGAQRDAADYRDYARPLADRQCLLVLAPLFDRHTFPSWRYQRGGIVGKTGAVQDARDWTGRLVLGLVDWARMQEGRPLAYSLIAHSAGGQFLSRLAGLRPERGQAHRPR